MSTLNIRVGASVDRSLGVAFQPLIEGAKRAQVAVDASAKKAARSISTETRKGTKDAEARFRELEKEVATGMPRAMNVGSRAVMEFAREARMNLANTKRSFAEMAREAEHSMSRIEAANKKAAKSGAASKLFNMAGGGEGVKAGLSRSGRMAYGIGRKAIGAAAGIAGSLAHGFGVNTDMTSVFHKNAELQNQAVMLSNASLIKGDARNGVRIDPTELMHQVMDTSAKTGTDANATMEGLRKFVDLTGDLKGGREVLMDLEMLAKATGTSMEDMVAAAGEISLALGDTEGKSGKIVHLMKQFAGQGEMGAISIRALATNMAKIASSAGQFSGKREENIAFLGVIGQEARRGGGANSASMAATAVAGFVNTLKTPARAKAFEAATGKSVFHTEGKDKGKIRPAQEILMDALNATGMDPLAFKKIFANIKGAQGPEALATIYRDKGGGKAGADAVTAELERLKGALIDDEQILVSFKAAMQTGEAQANVFNNQIREVAMQIQLALIPVLVELGPSLVSMAEGVATLVEFLTGAKMIKKKVAANHEEETAAIAMTRKQLARAPGASGTREIAQEQVTINEKLEQRLAESKDKAGFEAKRAEMSADSPLINWIRKVGGTDEMIRKNTGRKPGKNGETIQEEDARTARATADQARADWLELKTANQEISNALKNHTINVRVVNPDHGGKPPEHAAGRSDSPEEKAAEGHH